MEAGKPIWVESLMSPSEYSEQARKYPNMYGNGSKPRPEFECEFKWRKGMGGKLPNSEIARRLFLQPPLLILNSKTTQL